LVLPSGNFTDADSRAFNYAIDKVSLGDLQGYLCAIISSFSIVSEQGFSATGQQITIGKVSGPEDEELVELIIRETSIPGELNRAEKGFLDDNEDKDQLVPGEVCGVIDGLNAAELQNALDVLVDGLVLVWLAGLGADFGENGGSCDSGVAFDLNFGDGSAFKIRSGGGLSKGGIDREPRGLSSEQAAEQKGAADESKMMVGQRPVQMLQYGTPSSTCGSCGTSVGPKPS